jgi:hypothetical protein
VLSFLLVLGKLFDDKVISFHNPILPANSINSGIVLLFIDNYFQNPTIIKEEDILIKKSKPLVLAMFAMMPERAGQQLPLLVACSISLPRQEILFFQRFQP